MHNGRIIKSSKTIVEGTHKMHGYSDTWDESYDIEYADELTPEVCSSIVSAFMGSAEYASQSGSSYGSLRWPLADSNVRVDTEARQVLVTRGSGMCD